MAATGISSEDGADAGSEPRVFFQGSSSCVRSIKALDEIDVIRAQWRSVLDVPRCVVPDVDPQILGDRTVLPCLDTLRKSWTVAPCQRPSLHVVDELVQPERVDAAKAGLDLSGEVEHGGHEGS